MDAVDLLQQLVAIPSLSGNEREAVDFLVSAMSGLGFSAEVDKAGNAVGIRQNIALNGRITSEIMLLGHIDTVPGDIPVRIEDGVLYGRGAVDAKSPLAAFIMAASQVVLPPGTRIVVVGAVEEESATSKGARHIVRNYSPDYCVIGEPSGWDGITLGYKGRILIDYKDDQDMGHTAGSQRSVAEKGIDWWNDLSSLIDEFNQGRERVFDQLLPSLRHVQTGSDGLRNQIDMKVGVRLPPDFDIEWLKEQVFALSNGAQLRMYAHEPAFQSSRRTPLARTFNKTFRQAGVKPRYKLKTGTSDMNVVGPLWQIPIVAYGPGDSSLDHAPNEHIVISEYLQSIEILQAVLTDMGREATAQ